MQDSAQVLLQLAACIADLKTPTWTLSEYIADLRTRLSLHVQTARTAPKEKKADCDGTSAWLLSCFAFVDVTCELHRQTFNKSPVSLGPHTLTIRTKADHRQTDGKPQKIHVPVTSTCSVERDISITRCRCFAQKTKTRRTGDARKSQRVTCTVTELREALCRRLVHSN